MAINAKAVSLVIVKFFQFSVKCMCNYAKKYPLPSATLFIIFILHLFFPFAFIFLVFSVPFFLFGYIIYRRFVPSPSKPDAIKPKSIDSIKHEADQCVAVKNHNIDSNTTKRRNVKSTTDDSNRQEDMKRVKFCLSPNDNDNNTIERKEKVEERDKEVANESSSTEDEEDEDDAQEDGFRNQILEWTEDDQKNLMEVGFSELEKNLTLENMIAKRKAGKFSMSPRTPESIFPHVSFTRSNPFDEIPGTAPSSFSRNPFYQLSGQNDEFDIYDLDLMGPYRNNDKLCRHESFTRGTSFSTENLRNQESRMLGIFSCMERILAGDSDSDKGDHDRLIEELLNQDEESEDSSSPSSSELGDQVTEETANQPSEIGGGLGSIQTEDTKDLSSSKSEELDEISNAIENNKILSSTNQEILSTNGTLEKANQTLLNDYVNRNVAHHHSMPSVASDMQVEVSEPASPRNVSSAGDLQLLVSEGDLKLESQEKIESSDKPKEEAVYFVDNSDSMAHPADLVHSANHQKPSSSPSSYSKGNTTAESSENDKEEINNQKPSTENGTGSTNPNELDIMNISTSTSQNVGDNANLGTFMKNKENPDSPTQPVISEHNAPIEDMKSEDEGMNNLEKSDAHS